MDKIFVGGFIIVFASFVLGYSIHQGFLKNACVNQGMTHHECQDWND